MHRIWVKFLRANNLQLEFLVRVPMELHDVSPHLLHPKVFDSTGVTSIGFVLSMNYLFVLHQTFDFPE